MARKKFLRYLTFGSLYFTQGTILGFFAALNALYLLDKRSANDRCGHLWFHCLDPLHPQDRSGNPQRQGQSFWDGPSQAIHIHRAGRTAPLPGYRAFHQSRHLFLGICGHRLHYAIGDGAL